MKDAASIILAIACSVASAGCFDADLPGGTPSSPALLAPGGAIPIATDGGDRSFDVFFDYAAIDLEGDPELYLWNLGVIWYISPLRGGGAPHDLQAIVQKASGIGVAAGRGEFDFGGSLGESDISSWGLQGRFVFGDDSQAPGLGCQYSFSKNTVDDLPVGVGVGDELESSGFQFALLGYVPQLDGLILRVGGSIEKSELSGDREVADGPFVGARYYREIVDGQWIDASATVGFLFFHTGLSAVDDDDLVDWEVALSYYPLRELGMGVTFGGRNFDEIDDDSNRIALEASWSLERWAPGLNLDIAWQKKETDDEKETSLVFGVEYRF